MIPVQMIRVGLGDEAIHVPVFRLPYVGGRDGFGRPGGFFVSKDGEYGVLVDAQLPPEQAQSLVADEIRSNLPRLTALVAQQFEQLKREQHRPSLS